MFYVFPYVNKHHVFNCFVEQEIHVTAMVSFMSALFIYGYYLGFKASSNLPRNLSDIGLFDAWQDRT